MPDYPILNRIDDPRQLASLSLAELKQLAEEIRRFLLETVPVTGGHLSSNLGAVELTIALHRVFESPRDKIIWDVGHQGYVHKLLTGRRDKFITQRQYGGISGFLVREESPHDPFGAGHAGTSISAALGMAVARDLKKESHHVIAVIGDGSLTSGMALEAMNHAGHLGTRLIVVLNDNEMSIAHNVGAISRALNRLRIDPRYHRAKEEVDHVLQRLPGGAGATDTGRKVLHGLKALVLPNLLWEELGFTFVGPIDGHSLAELEEAFELAKEYNKPAVIHIKTQKGHGYGPAEEDATQWHGVAPNGTGKRTAPSYTGVFGKTLAREMRSNPKVVAVTAAMPDGTGLAVAAQEFPSRVFDVGIAEQHAVTFAAGLAAHGLAPVTAIYSTFLQRSYDQVIHDVCIQKLPVFFGIDRGGIVGDDGKTHQGLFDLSFLRVVPELVVAASRDENELQLLVHTGIQYVSEGLGPFALRYPRGAGVGVPMEEDLRVLPIGKGELLREGRDLAILAIGNTVAPSLEAAYRLSEQGVSCAVVDARFLKPLDEGLILEVARRCGRVMTVEENVAAGGFGSAVLELLAAHGMAGVPVELLAVPDEFVEHGNPTALRAKYGLDAQGIVRRATESFHLAGMAAKIGA
ncbi:MAG: 1-deoxy-D-xylulose-5-phosphate synthase [Chloroflexi bacterium]|nr:1-deoxy-D-xylulose-5-phosphate synthase [Chloroflexota bacterium]